jgi:hypothetical protein
MNREDIQKLIGGYATGTLTPAEQDALFAAALEDQELFDTLAREQAVRDLLRDPAAKAEVLAALDTPERGGFWAWVRRPVVAGLAMAGVVCIAVIAVWQTAQVRPAPPAPQIVAQLKSPEVRPAVPKVAPAAPVPRAKRAARPVAEKDVAAPAPAPAPPPPAKAKADALAAAEAIPLEKVAVDARGLFYGNSFVPQASFGVAGGAPVAQTLAARTAAVPALLGVRVGILRGDEEITAGTVLTTGERVRLKLTPNSDGFLYVAAREGDTWTMVASETAQRLKPFETPPLPFATAGEKQVYIMLSRRPQLVAPRDLAGLVRPNVVESVADQDRATYVVAATGNAPAQQQVVQPITLTYR